MRSLLLVPALLLAAACGEKAAPEEMTPEAPPAPAALTAADVAGSWNGMTMAAGTDSVTNRWTSTSTSDTTGTLTMEGMADPVGFTTMFDADSMVATSFPYVDPAREDGMMVMWRSVGRRQADGQIGGTVETMVVGTNEVVARGEWHMTKAPM
jgi:hypothetical protein